VTLAHHDYRLPRLLHPAAWWAWAIGLAMAANRTTNPLLLTLIVVVAAYVVAARRELGAASPFGAFLRLGLLAITLRVVFQVLLGGGTPGRTVLFTLPEIPLPSGSSGVRLGGPADAGVRARGGIRGGTTCRCARLYRCCKHACQPPPAAALRPRHPV